MRVKLNGEVVGDSELWLYDFFDIPAFSPQRVRDAIDATPEGEDLILEINSGGGSVFAGFEMYSVLQNAAPRTVAEIQSLAGSAASVVMLGADEVVASPVALVMIHLPSAGTWGDRYDHLDSVGVLDSVTDSILNAYAVKCGGKTGRSELKSLMKASTWLTAPEAKGLGLVDRIAGEEQIDPAAILNRTATGRPFDYKDLLARYRDLVARGEAPDRPELGIVNGSPRESAGEPAACSVIGPDSTAAPRTVSCSSITAGTSTGDWNLTNVSTTATTPTFATVVTGTTLTIDAPTAWEAAREQQEEEAELQGALARLELEKIRFGG